MTLNFLQQFLRHPKNVGAVAASSKGLSKLMMNVALVRDARVIVEFGPGTGIFTESILAEKQAEAHFLALEINEVFAKGLTQKYPKLDVVHDSAIHAKKHLNLRGHQQCDCIISGLPWSLFEQELQERLLAAVHEILKPGGRFVTIAYLQGVVMPAGLSFKKKLHSSFSSVHSTSTVWWNIPPAFLYVAVK